VVTPELGYSYPFPVMNSIENPSTAPSHDQLVQNHYSSCKLFTPASKTCQYIIQSLIAFNRKT
jgi:hypothetical protein